MKKITLTKMVETCLRNIPETRDNDMVLTIEVIKKYYPQYRKQSSTTGKFGYLEEDLFKIPDKELVKRIRAKFNSSGKYYPTDWKIAKARGIKEDKWRVENGYKTKEDTLHPSRSESYMDNQREFKG